MVLKGLSYQPTRTVFPGSCACAVSGSMKVIAMARDNMITIIRVFLAKELLNVHMSLITSLHKCQFHIAGRLTCNCMSVFFLSLSATLCHQPFFFPGFRKSGPFPLSLKTNQIGYKPRSLAKSDDGHITILRLNNFFQVIPHNVARADSKKKRVLLKPFFCRNTLCIPRKSDKIRVSFFWKMPQANCAVLP